MRIVAGVWRGRSLRAPAGPATRPTSDRAREGLFSMLASRLGSFDGLRVADLFAGTGALGLEALSRGAAHCTFVETDRAAIAALRANVESLGAAERADIRAQDAAAFSGGPFDLVLMDPPYGTGLAEAAAERLPALLAPGGWASIETEGEGPPLPASLEPAAERRFGKARIFLVRKAPTDVESPAAVP